MLVIKSAFKVMRTLLYYDPAGKNIALEGRCLVLTQLTRNNRNVFPNRFIHFEPLSQQGFLTIPIHLTCLFTLKSLNSKICSKHISSA